jgi:glutathione S-transferase
MTQIQGLKLIGGALSPYAVRVMLAARFKGIELAIEPPATGPRSAEHLARNPIGKVPVLVDGALVLPESDVIVAYLEDRMPLPTLFPGDAAQRSNVRLLCRLIDTYSAPSFGPFIANDQQAIAVAMERIDASLGYIDHFRLDGEFASGDAFSAADCALIPFFNAFEGLQEPFKTYDLVRKRPRLQAWWERARATELGQFARAAIAAAVTEMLRSRPRR